MLEFKTIEGLNLNLKLMEIIKDYTYKTKKKVKFLLNTNLQFTTPTKYLIT